MFGALLSIFVRVQMFKSLKNTRKTKQTKTTKKIIINSRARREVLKGRKTKYHTTGSAMIRIYLVITETLNIDLTKITV